MLKNFSNIAIVASVDATNTVFKITGPDLGENAYKKRYQILVTK